MDRLGQAGDGVAALDLHRELFIERISRTDAHLDLLGGAFADEQIVRALHVIDHGGVELVAGDADRLRKHDAAERNDRDLRGATADVDDHVGGGFVDRQSDPNGGGHRFWNGDHVAGAGVHRRFLHRAFLNLGDAGGDGDHDPGWSAEGIARHLADEVAQHRLRDVEVGDHAILHRADGGDIAGRAAQHPLRIFADGTDLAGRGIEGDHGRLTQHDALVFDVNESVGGAQIDADVVGEIAEDIRHDASARVWRFRDRGTACNESPAPEGVNAVNAGTLRVSAQGSVRWLPGVGRIAGRGA